MLKQQQNIYTGDTSIGDINKANDMINQHTDMKTLFNHETERKEKQSLKLLLLLLIPPSSWENETKT